MNICPGSSKHTLIQFTLISFIIVELMLRRDTFTVLEGDTGFESYVLIFVDIVIIRSPMIGQQMVDLDFTVSSSATSMYS